MSANVSSLSAEVAYTSSGPAEVSSLSAEVGYQISYADAEVSSLSAEVAYAGGANTAVARVALLFAEVAYRVLHPTPMSLSINPDWGYVGGGEAVTLTGAGFTVGAQVTFGADPATEVVVVNASTITCLTPPHTGGLTTVTVTLPDGRSDSLVNGFTYFRIPPYECQDRFPAQEPLP